MVAGLKHSGLSTLYVSGEESLTQLALRARRLGLAVGGLKLLAQTNVESILSLVNDDPPAVLVIDSIQTMFSDEIPSAPGSVSQVRESAARLIRFAKQRLSSVKN